MLETIAASLVVAAVTGLSFLAYRHPKGYSKLGTFTSCIVSISYIIYVIWVAGYQQGFYEGRQDKENFGNPDLLVEPFPWLFIIVLIVQGYLSLLGKLPKILEVNKNEDKENDGDN